MLRSLLRGKWAALKPAGRPSLRFYTPANKMSFHPLREKTPFKHQAAALLATLVFAAPVIAIFSSRDPVPLTNRLRPMFVDEEFEKELGEQALKQLPVHKSLPKSDRRVKAVVEVSLRIADAVEDLLDDLNQPKRKKQQQQSDAAKEVGGGNEDERKARIAAEKLFKRARREQRAQHHAALVNESTGQEERPGVLLPTGSVLSGFFSTAAAEEPQSPPKAPTSSVEGEAAAKEQQPPQPPQATTTPRHHTSRFPLVRRVMKMLGYQQERRFEWRVIVIDDPKVVNALCAPSGYIVVFTGLLNFIDKATREGSLPSRESALAAVLSHEISHAVARHGAEKFSTQAPFAMLLSLLRESSPLLPLAYTFLFERANSREMEREADTIGLHLMSRACYDTRAASKFFRALKSGNTALSAYLSTHPADEERAESAAAMSAVLALKQRHYCSDAHGHHEHKEQGKGSGHNADDEEAFIVRDSRVERWLTDVSSAAGGNASEAQVKVHMQVLE